MQKSWLLLATTLAFVAGCSDSQQAAPVPETDIPDAAQKVSSAEADVSPSMKTLTAADPDPWVVVESFEVGRDVYVRSLALDAKNQSLWVGTSVGVHEVDLSDQSLRNTFTRADGLANEYVFAIFVDSHDNKWFGTNGGGASRLNNGQWHTYFPMHGVADYWVYSFAEQASGGVWIGTWDGVTHWDPQSGAFTTYVRELINEWVYGIGVDSKDRVWFGTEGGVSMFDGNQWRSWTHKDGLGAPNEENLPISFNTGLGTRTRHDLNVLTGGAPTYNPNYVFSVHVDQHDHVWVGTWGGGVARYDGRRWKNYNMSDGLAGNIVYSIGESADGTLWVGTDRGVSRFDGKQWYRYGREQGLLNEHVYALAVVANDEVWVGTRGAVTRLALSGENKKQAGVQ